MKRRKTIPRSVLSTALIISTLHKVQLLTGKNLFLSLALSLAIAAGNEQPVWAQLNANASFDLGHDISQVLTSMTGSGTQPLCTQNSAQLGTTLLLDQNLCGFSAPGGPLPNISASDTSGAVGPTHYIQTVNFSVTIYSKSGTVVYGPFPTTAFWTNFTPINGKCAEGLSDEVVMYDHDADRWMFTKFARQANGDGTVSWYQCFAVSTTSDPLGSYYRYAFFIDLTELNDYPKFGTWPDAYYMTADRDKLFVPPQPGAIGKGDFVAAFERSKMLGGQPAQGIVFKIPNNGLRSGMLPADWDGRTPPPAGSPNYLARTLDPNLGWPTYALEIWSLQVDWNAGNGVLNTQNSLTPDPFNSALCQISGGYLNQACIPQPDTDAKLDPQAGGRPMFRLIYRNFGDHEALAFTHTVEVGDFDDHSGIRWYELRRTGGDWFIYQQSIFAPDADYRWMGSIAMDRAGNMAMGYNTSSPSVYPGIRIAGRQVSDPPGTMSEEAILQGGSGSHTSASPEFADYSQTTVDPLDDCTFWYTGTYQPFTSDQYTWATKIGSFRFPTCVTDLGVTKTLSPAGAIAAGTNVTYTIIITNNGPNDAGNIILSDDVPVGTGFVSLSKPVGWNCNAPLPGKSGPLTCTTTSLPNGTSATFTIVATVNCSTPDGTAISNTASITAQTPPDSNHSNDSQSASFTVSNPVPVVTVSVALSLLPQNNHNLVNVGLAAAASDGPCPAPTNLPVQVFGNEDDQTPTDSQGTVFSPDAKDIAVTTLRLRQERTDSGKGRVYLLIVKATDSAGGTGFASLTVVVPKSSSAADLAAVNTPASAAKSFADTHQGAPPSGYFVIGDGPIIGSKQ